MCGYEPFRHLTLSPLSPHRSDFNLLRLIFTLGDREMPVVFFLCPFFSVFNEFFILFHQYRKNNNEATVSTRNFSPKSQRGQSAATIIDFMNPTKEDC